MLHHPVKRRWFFQSNEKISPNGHFFQTKCHENKKEKSSYLSLWKKVLSALLKEHPDDKFFFPGGKQILKGSKTGDLSGTTARWHS